MTGLFAESSIAFYDGFSVIPGGWLDHHYVQLAIQLADSVTGLAWSFVVTVRFFFFRFPWVVRGRDGASPDTRAAARVATRLGTPRTTNGDGVPRFVTCGCGSRRARVVHGSCRHATRLVWARLRLQ